MNENLDLTKILNRCPAGTEFYHLIFGQVALREIIDDEYPIIVEPIINTTRSSLTKGGRLNAKYDGECLLYPSKYQRDWSKFVRFWDEPDVSKFDVETFHPFDKVLVRDYYNERWRVDIFGFMLNDCICCCTTNWRYCIPYNEDTACLVGTKDEPSEFYRYWDD